MSTGNFKLALNSIKSAKWRSFLTMLGIIIGVASVITTVSLGEGVRSQVSNQLNKFGKDLIFVRSGRSENQDQGRGLGGVNLFTPVSAALTDDDVKAVDDTKSVRAMAPLSLINAVPRYRDREFTKGMVIGTSSDLPELINQEVQYGAFFTVGEQERNVVVIGKTVAEELFQENVPVGKSLQLRGQEFIVRGVFEAFDNNPITPGGDLNSAVFIPYTIGKKLSGSALVYQILAKPNDESQLDATIDDMTESLKAVHDGQHDFTILKQGESLAQTNGILTLITSMVAGIAAISLLVGGIGIMNIMLVSVSERTHEIGIRKAIGATNRQIWRQFVVEAAVLSMVGSIVGVLVSLLANYLIRLFTSLEPAINLVVALIAVVVAFFVGVLFGFAPAIKAARKHPIDALRQQE